MPSGRRAAALRSLAAASGVVRDVEPNQVRTVQVTPTDERSDDAIADDDHSHDIAAAAFDPRIIRVTGVVGGPAGYLPVAEDDGIFTFRDVRLHSSLGDRPPARPVASVATVPS